MTTGRLISNTVATTREPMGKTDKWAKKMAVLLETINSAVHANGGRLPLAAKRFREQYRQLIRRAEQECPDSGKRAQSMSRNILIRVRDFEKEGLLFMVDMQYGE